MAAEQSDQSDVPPDFVYLWIRAFVREEHGLDLNDVEDRVLFRNRVEVAMRNLAVVGMYDLLPYFGVTERPRWRSRTIRALADAWIAGRVVRLTNTVDGYVLVNGILSWRAASRKINTHDAVAT